MNAGYEMAGLAPDLLGRIEMAERNNAIWRADLPRLLGRAVELREPAMQHLRSLVDLFSFTDATRFGLAAPVTDLTVQRFIDLTIAHRAAGVGFSYVITLGTPPGVVGLIQVGTHRLESRVPLQNGRANGALHKIAAMREGMLRHSVRGGDDDLDQVLWAVLKEDRRDRSAPSMIRIH
jgi:hypothetical protein